MPEDYHPTDEIQFEGQEHHEIPEEFQDHFFKAMAHHAGAGEHPGKYNGPPMRERPPALDTVTELARARMAEEGPPEPPPEPGAPPAQEAVEQPPAGGGKKKGAAPPHGTTPAGLGAEAVKPEEPEGNF